MPEKLAQPKLRGPKSCSIQLVMQDIEEVQANSKRVQVSLGASSSTPAGWDVSTMEETK